MSSDPSPDEQASSSPSPDNQSPDPESKDKSEAPWDGALYEGSPDEEPEREGDLNRYVMNSSMYTEARLHPYKAVGVGLLGLGAAWAISRAL